MPAKVIKDACPNCGKQHEYNPETDRYDALKVLSIEADAEMEKYHIGELWLFICDNCNRPAAIHVLNSTDGMHSYVGEYYAPPTDATTAE